LIAFSYEIDDFRQESSCFGVCAISKNRKNGQKTAFRKNTTCVQNFQNGAPGFDNQAKPAENWSKK
jgi:hypothetical protein